MLFQKKIIAPAKLQENSHVTMGNVLTINLCVTKFQIAPMNLTNLPIVMLTNVPKWRSTNVATSAWIHPLVSTVNATKDISMFL